ncbi:MAG: TetR/AcrR family transcriptional regulator [Anaerolineales bacterium]
MFRPTGLSLLVHVAAKPLKKRILHESLRLFSLKGYLSTSINDILDAAETSKGGFYNHFATKEDLFFEVLEEAQRIWRERALWGMKDLTDPVEKIQLLLRNYRDRYLKDSDNFPGGCIFVTFSVEMDDQRPHLAEEVNKGFVGLKRMLKRLLDEGKESGKLSDQVSTSAITEMLFSGMLGASVVYGVDKSRQSVDSSINALIDYLEGMRAQ